MSDPDRSSAAVAWFERLLELEPAAQAAALARLREDDAALASAVERLLAIDASSDPRLDRPAADWMPAAGMAIGPYRLEHLLGEGGMGEVWAGRRRDGAHDRPVAIKIIAIPGADAARRVARERDIVARLSHPNIAQLLDAGVGGPGLAYLVLERIDGPTLDRHVAERRLDWRGVLRLLTPIVEAVEFAHSQLVVHRDIKPSNILVDAHGVPKLLDFGIARLLGPGSGDATAVNQVALTPAYASPEQRQGGPVDTRSDIYSLGVVLEELVTGRAPRANGAATRGPTGAPGRARPSHAASRATSCT